MVRLFPAVAALMLLTAPLASAAPIDDAARELRTVAVWLDPAAKRTLDVAALTSAIGDAPIKIAILPAGPAVSEVSGLPRQLAVSLPGQTIAVIAGRYFYAGSEVLCDGEAGKAASGAINANETFLDANESSDLTKALTDFVTAVKAAPKCEGTAGRGDRYGATPATTDVAGVDDTTTVLPFVLGGVGLLVAGLAVWVTLTRGRARGRAQALRTDARALVDRLGAEVTDLPESHPGAARKHGEAAALLLGATTDVQFDAVRRTAVDGLVAARAARVELGLPAGAEIPELDHEPLSGPSRVTAD
ncbi:hypothetical protein [Alloactinosynnema sp. L-07]|uniref:hypothetical protein n=1 Tax=Alloactinosynnema sp. L-07 TaxID=1653480 RepID=UPI00065F097D|nr:hypothetical protein [Alloactinosynnema sp. L-07]CRK60742.1 hypothetical protein [Alloactinosynnema sp. L-07]